MGGRDSSSPAVRWSRSTSGASAPASACKGTVHIPVLSVSDPGCLSRIPDTTFPFWIPDPHKRIHVVSKLSEK
jgi:hypothetical protein